MNKFMTLIALSVFSSTAVLAETPFNQNTDAKIEVPAQVKESIEKAMASSKEAVSSNVNEGINKAAATVIGTDPKSAATNEPELKAAEKTVAEGTAVVEKMEPVSPISAPQAPQANIEIPMAKKPMMDGQGPHGKMNMMKRPDGPMPKTGITLSQTNPNMPLKMPMKNHQGHGMKMMKNHQPAMPPRMMGNQQTRMPSMNAPQGMMPMMGSTGMGMPNAVPMVPNQGYYMPMMNMQMMQQHRMGMENRLANIEALLKELVELQKSKK